VVHWGSHAGYSWSFLALRIVPIVDDSISWCRPQTLGFQPESLRLWYSPLQFLLQRRYTVRRGLRWRILHHSVIIQELLHEAESLVCGTTLSLMQRFRRQSSLAAIRVSSARSQDCWFPLPGYPTRAFHELYREFSQGHRRRDMHDECTPHISYTSPSQ